jgi:hypothetical protein
MKPNLRVTLKEEGGKEGERGGINEGIRRRNARVREGDLMWGRGEELLLGERGS